MKHIIKSLLDALLLTAIVAPTFAGPIYNGHTYTLTTVASSWTLAEAEAISAGGHLVAINDAAEQSYLISEFGLSRFWIGLNDVALEGTFDWSNGDLVTYTNWSGGEPNNAGGNEDYTVMNWTAGGTWNDCPNAGCGGHFGIIEVANIPEPSTVLILLSGLMILVGRRKIKL